ncbi:hypothetical protein HIM_12061 [Hirsutella minnesotensis 3608]|uniref:AB hydrolase-1 domain-containing protein n=1 Tax=Hirsutella minnesotensis 3608 TaxID=1043627 RepID=A0A0F8A0H2_9HYPO|nr:hypothetical protein HIM_12061 [Hirsutella minnesotensis 3608]
MEEYGKYINTPQTAADINSILDAVGQQNLVYWGTSYGTVLGQTYAALFPERCGRIVLDGVVNYFEWYKNLLPESAYSGMRRVLDGFFDECVKAGGRCSLASFARSKEVQFSSVQCIFRPAAMGRSGLREGAQDVLS